MTPPHPPLDPAIVEAARSELDRWSVTCASDDDDDGWLILRSDGDVSDVIATAPSARSAEERLSILRAEAVLTVAAPMLVAAERR